ncbi:NUDIX hydrolase, partial [Streptococcus agalactiae]|uniref:NUDIX hydrolase n=1 Tax=Streptococcus agalactiae TaxID=1311 RepID=UPI00178C4BFF
AATPTAAAVLVPVTDRAEPGLVLTQRTEHLRNHAGQIAFPGGRADPGDVDLVATALREAKEEIGLSPHAVTVVGLADRYRTVIGFEVT